MSHLAGKTVAITGASRGIGAAAARHFAEAGAKVVLAARSGGDIERIAAELTDAGHVATAFACDVSDYGAVAGMVAHCEKAHGGLDVLINNAGLIDPIARIGDSDPDAWDVVVDVNLKGVYHCIRAALPVMERAGGGTIINISSGAATNALEGWSHYCATKAAVLSLTKCTHEEYGERGIRVVGLSPGTVATDMQMAIKESGVNPVSAMDWDAHIPPEWVAKSMAFLCGPGGAEFAGTDFSIKTPEGRALVGLPAPVEVRR